jgi:branched-chain amino acid transport system ATP-binding protein
MLDVTGIVAGYGRVPVLQGVSLNAQPGEIVTLVGANGAGKSTLLRVIAGLLSPWEGRIALEGVTLTNMAAHRRVGRGIVLVPEGRMLFPTMNVDENLTLGAYLRTRRERKAVERDRARVFELFPVLAERRGQAAGTLSGGEQQRLAIGRALMSAPKVLLLDEPSLGLAPKVIAEIFSVLDRLRETGLTMVLVEQDAKAALKHADRGYVMRTGQIALSGSAEALLNNDDVRLIYLGARSTNEG